MEHPQRDFKGVWIPKEIWLSPKLSLTEKVVFVEIHSLDKDRGCFAENAHFAGFFGISARQVARYVASLKKKGMVTVTIENLNERTIHVTPNYATVAAQGLQELVVDVPTLAPSGVERPLRDFKGVWIPREIWLSKELTLIEKVIFVEIHSLDNERGCFASNAYFARFFRISIRQAAHHIGCLREKGFITVAIENLSERTIHVSEKYPFPNAHQLRELKRDREALAARFSISRRGGV